MGTQIIRVGSRDSLLAVAQSQLVIALLKTAHPEQQIELVTMKTTGDKILDRPLQEIGGKGLFVKELDAALLAGRIDCSVHSLKDLPMEEDPRLPLAAFTKREDPRDALILPEGKTILDPGKPIGCSSLRRQYMLQKCYPEYRFESVRGNLQTRLRKLDAGGYSALVLASAGFLRLGLQERISRIFSVEECLPAAGQGILAVQTREDEVRELFSCVEDASARAAALAERAFVRALGGGCSAPIAAYATVSDSRLLLRGFFYDEDKHTQQTGQLEGACSEAPALGEALARSFATSRGEE